MMDRDVASPHRGDDRTVRVFISSTFRDMHAEQDVLVTAVFPELRERLDRLGLEFFDVDLRWGVPQTGVDGERANSWAYCKQWIERVESNPQRPPGGRFPARVDEQSSCWDQHLTVFCSSCGLRLPVDRPDPASDDADVPCPAPDCGQLLRLTPFVCDPRNSGWG